MSRRVAFACVASCAITAATSVARTQARPTTVHVSSFTPVELPESGQRYGITSIVESGGVWWAAGSFVDEAGQHRPGLWTSTDSITWSRVATAPITPYGEVSELYSVAASGNGLAALGMATGGAHGNPRTVSWLLGAEGALHEVAAGFELYNGVRQISVRSIVAGPHGWVIFGSRNNRNEALGATSWTSATGDDFVIHDNDAALSSRPHEQLLGLDVTTQDARLLAVGERFARRNGTADTDGIAWTSPDGVLWQRWTPAGLNLGGPQAQRAQRIDASGQRILIGGTETDARRTRFVAWVSGDGLAWTRSVIPVLGESGDALSSVTVARTTGLVDLVGAKVGNRLRLAMSTRGQWTQIALPNGLPSDVRATITVGSDGSVLLVGAAGLDGGGLWRARIG